MENEVKESIWADGVPANIQEETKMNIQDLLNMGVNFLCKNVLEKQGVSIKRASADPTQLPNVIVEKNEKIYGITIVPFLYPRYGFINDKARVGVTKMLHEKNAISLFCPLGFKSIDEERAKAELALKGDLFNVMFRGFVVLTDEEQQDLARDAKFITEIEEIN